MEGTVTISVEEFLSLKKDRECLEDLRLEGYEIIFQKITNYYGSYTIYGKTQNQTIAALLETNEKQSLEINRLKGDLQDFRLLLDKRKWWQIWK